MNVYNYVIDGLNTCTELCRIGSEVGTDKSPYNKSNSVLNFRHSYTPFYSMIFSHIRDKKINFGEIGIFKNSSIKMWRKYFKNASIYAWDGSYENIENAEKDNLENVFYEFMHTEYENTIIDAFSKLKCKLDVLIDDASHNFWDQIRVIRNCTHYLNSGSMLIIEDVNNNIDEYEYIQEIKNYEHDKYYDSISFINFNHSNRYLNGYDNDKIALLYRSNI